MDTKYLKKVGLYILSVILALALIFYIVYHLMDGFTTDISTISAEISTRKSVIAADGYIFRDEHYVYSSYGGAINYAVSSGEKVGINQALADTFSDASGYAISSEIDELEKKITILEESTVPPGSANTDTHSVDKNISSFYRMILSNVAQGKFSHAIRTTDSLLIQMNRRQMITGEAEGYSALRNSLEARKNSLSAKLTGLSETVFSDKSGYFFTGVDGYENILNTEALSSMSVSSFYELISRAPQNVSAESGKAVIGKLTESYVWYISLPITSKQAEELRVGNTYTAVFPYNYDTELTLTLDRVLTEFPGTRAVAVFSCGEMPEDFVYLRSQAVEIVISESNGFRVPKSAVRLIDGEKGVYTLYGSTVIFKRINILLDMDGYYMVSLDDPLSLQEDTEKPKYSYLKLYDRIIVSGKDLEHGMVFY
ncbi:MAG: hypothetical protein E7671_05005 [Ruminococcaceae bacterium]|nr:hypothetical protein [Oscillospiraceae bacterium]